MSQEQALGADPRDNDDARDASRDAESPEEEPLYEEPPSDSAKRARPRRAALVYHAVAAGLVVLGGLALFALGLWLRATDNGVDFHLHYEGDSWHPLFLNFGAGFMALGTFVLFASALMLLCFSRRDTGRLFRVLFVALAAAIFAGLFAACVVSAVLAARMDSARTRDAVRAAWDASARVQPAAVCALETRFRCRGLDDGECVDCRLGTETRCEDAGSCVLCARAEDGVETETGCYDKIAAAVRRVFIPIAAGSGFVATVLLGDAFVSFLI